MYVPFPAIIQFFSRTPENVLLRTSGGTRTQGWELLSYHIPVCKESSERK
jgi:hypothetical protein